MAYSTLSTVVAGAVVAESWGNQVKANFDAGPNALATAAGQVFYATAAGVLVPLNVGTAGQVLRVNAGATAPEWGAAPFPAFVGARVYSATGPTIANNTFTALSFGSERFDTASLHSTSTNTSRITADRAGYWHAIANVGWFGSTAGVRQLSIVVNSGNTFGRSYVPATSTSFLIQHVSTVVSLAATDYVEVYVQQDSGGNLDVLAAGPYTPEFTLYYLGA